MATTAVQQVYITAKANLAATLAAEIAYEMVNGARPQYSLDGESYDFPGYMAKAQEIIDKFDTLIQREDGAFQVVSHCVI
jgi:hypothetical protein